jgi:hypothetical protein
LKARLPGGLFSLAARILPVDMAASSPEFFGFMVKQYG